MLESKYKYNGILVSEQESYKNLDGKSLKGGGAWGFPVSKQFGYRVPSVTRYNNEW